MWDKSFRIRVMRCVRVGDVAGWVDASYRWRRVVGGHWFSSLTSDTAAVHECCRVPFTGAAVALSDHVDVLSDLAVQCQELLLAGHAVEGLDSRRLPFGPFHLRQSLPHVPRDQVGPASPDWHSSNNSFGTLSSQTLYLYPCFWIFINYKIVLHYLLI